MAFHFTTVNSIKTIAVCVGNYYYGYDGIGYRADGRRSECPFSIRKGRRTNVGRN